MSDKQATPPASPAHDPEADALTREAMKNGTGRKTSEIVDELRATLTTSHDQHLYAVREVVRLETENAELRLRRSETVAMCEQLRLENTRLKEELDAIEAELAGEDW